MAIIDTGILGNVSGKIGGFVISNWKGKKVIRSVPKRKKNRKVSEGQVQQRAKFALASIYLRPLAPLFHITFGNCAKNMSASNLAFSHMLNVVITGVYPDLIVNWPELLISKGSLPLPRQVEAKENGGRINFTWSPGTFEDSNRILSDDRSVLLVICPGLEQAIYTTSGQSRSTGAAAIDAGNFSGHEVHTYFAFVSANGKQASMSEYTGMLTLP